MPNISPLLLPGVSLRPLEEAIEAAKKNSPQYRWVDASARAAGDREILLEIHFAAIKQVGGEIFFFFSVLVPEHNEGREKTTTKNNNKNQKANKRMFLNCREKK